jgi:hypothetical protein
MSVKKVLFRIWRLWVAIFVISTLLHLFGVKIQFLRSYIMLKPVSNTYQSFLQALIGHVKECKEETQLFAHYGFYHYPHQKLDGLFSVVTAACNIAQWSKWKLQGKIGLVFLPCHQCPKQP